LVSVELAFITLAAIIIIGYFGLIFFKKTKVSEIIILLLIGLLIGPIASELGMSLLGPTEIQIFQSFLPFFAGFALIMILFEGGMHLNFFKTVKALTGTLGFTLMVFVLTLGLTVGVLWFLGLAGLGAFDPLLALFIAAIVGGTSSAVVIPLVKNTSAKDETKTMLSLESALTDSLCVITAVAIGEIFLLGTISVAGISTGILANFSIAAILGFAFGLIWLKALAYLQGRPYEYLMTIAMLLLLYGLVQFVGGNGAIAALIFGIVLGNSEDITNMLKLTTRSIDKNIKNFQNEISFLVKTFFFVYLGILFQLEFLTPIVIVISITIILIILFARFISTSLLIKVKPLFSSDKNLITTMSARGLAAAVLVSVPVSMGLTSIPNTPFTPELLSQITAIAFLVIFFSNILTTLGLFVSEGGKPQIDTPDEREKLLKDIKVGTTKPIIQKRKRAS